jgi:hypothetical protein
VHHLMMWRRTVATLFLASHLLASTACTTWKTRQGDVGTIIAPPPRPAPDPSTQPLSGAGLAAAQPVYDAPSDTVRFIRVTTVSGTTMDLYDPRVANDSLYASVNKKGPESAFALADIRDVKTQGFDAVGTIGGVLVGTAIVVGLMALAAHTMCNATFGDC